MTAAPPTECRALAYARAVIAGEIVAGRLVRLACERHIADLETGDARGLRWNQAAADRAIEFFTHLRQSKGRWAGKPLILQGWQAFCVGSAFGWQRWDEHLQRWVRRVRIVYIEVAKKNGKTTLIAGIGLYLLDFDDEAGAEIYSAATKRDQARLCWDEMARMARRTPALGRRFHIVDSTAHIVVPNTSSKAVALGADRDSADGINPHGGLIDELHRHKSRELVDIIVQSTAARVQPMIVYVTTAGVPGESIYMETHQYARQVVEGTVQDDEWFAYLATLDEGDDWKDLAAYGKANPSLGVTVQMEELIRERDRAIEVPGKQNAFRRLRLNQITQQLTRWITLEAWDACRVVTPDAELKARRKWFGIDLGGTKDLNALGIVIPDGKGGYDVRAKFWMPAENIARRVQEDHVPYDVWAREGWIALTPGNTRDDQRILDGIRAEAVTWGNVAEVDVDPWQINYIATQLIEERVEVVKVSQGFANLAAASEEFEKCIAAGTFRHDGNPVLRWMIGNLTADEDSSGNKKPSKAKSTERIDGVSALVTALARAMLGPAQPPAQPPRFFSRRRIREWKEEQQRLRDAEEEVTGGDEE